MRNRSYRELRRLETFEERFDYLSLRGSVGSATFGFDRWINQDFYRSKQWKDIRHQVIVRDNGCDMGVDGYEIYDKIIIHHLTPMTPEDIEEGNPMIFDLDNLITTTHNTHNAIHYGDKSLLPHLGEARRPGDTTLWGGGRRVG